MCQVWDPPIFRPQLGGLLWRCEWVCGSKLTPIQKNPRYLRKTRESDFRVLENVHGSIFAYIYIYIYLYMYHNQLHTCIAKYTMPCTPPFPIVSNLHHQNLLISGQGCQLLHNLTQMVTFLRTKHHQFRTTNLTLRQFRPPEKLVSFNLKLFSWLVG